MTIKYDNDNNCETHTCGVCGHTYTYHYDYEKRMDYEGKPFIKLEEPLLREVEVPWGPNKIERVNQYACPICGVLQIDVG